MSSIWELCFFSYPTPSSSEQHKLNHFLFNTKYSSDTRPVARLGQGGAIAPPNIFFAPPNEVGLSFKIFVCIHLLCEINVQCMLCSPWLFYRFKFFQIFENFV